MPIAVAEQVESAQEAFEAGAAIVHAHVRNKDGGPTSPALCAAARGPARALPGDDRPPLTGGRSGAGPRARGDARPKPEMASLAVGSKNFPRRVYENSPHLVDWLASEMLVNKVKPEIEAFDLSDIFQAVAMAGAAKLKAPLYVQFVMGVKNAMPVDRPVFDFYVETLKRLAPDAEWCGAGIGRHQITLNEWCVASRRPRPDRAQGQRPPRPRHAGAVERRPRPPGGGALRESTAARSRRLRRRGRSSGSARARRPRTAAEGGV